jgi:hypothetical protein
MRRAGQNFGPPCGQINRRSFLADMGMGFAGLAIGSMFARDGIVRASELSHALPTGKPAFAPRAKNVIWIFLSGGVSHLETFDPKPTLNQFPGKTYDQTKLPNPQKSPLFLERSRSVVGMPRDVFSKIMPLQVGFKKYGQCGMDVSDWLPNLATCVDDIAFVRSMYTTDNDHAAEFQMHTGRHLLDEVQPVIGSWIHYGLGSLNENLPQFVFLGEFKNPLVKKDFNPGYLGPEHAGVQLSLDPKAPLPFAARPADVSAQEQQNQFELIRDLNNISSVEYPADEKLAARIKSYELAFRMQMSVPEAMDLSKESQETQSLYGIDNETTSIYGRRLLAARRLAERGVRFTLTYLSDYGEWDSHQQIKKLHAQSCARIDKPVAGLLKDLKRRGMWDDTVVVFCSEFGRTPALEDRKGFDSTGRDHHPHGFTIWLAGAGIKGGTINGATDELGFHAVESPHYVTDIHATIMHLLGVNFRSLEIPGRKRLDIDWGTPIWDIMA